MGRVCLPHGYRVPSDTRGPCSPAEGACDSLPCRSARAILGCVCRFCEKPAGLDQDLAFERIGSDLVVVSHEACRAR